MLGVICRDTGAGIEQTDIISSKDFWVLLEGCGDDCICITCMIQ